MKITTKSGFKCDIDEKKVKDWRFVKCLALVDSDDESEKLQGITKAVPLILGSKGEKDLMAFLEDANGVADTESVIAEFVDILTKINAKN